MTTILDAPALRINGHWELFGLLDRKHIGLPARTMSGIWQEVAAIEAAVREYPPADWLVLGDPGAKRRFVRRDCLPVAECADIPDVLTRHPCALGVYERADSRVSNKGGRPRIWTPDSIKRCSSCGEERALDEFHRNRSKRDGRSDRCADCTKAKQKAYRKRWNATP
jgi:hypothetical protein